MAHSNSLDSVSTAVSLGASDLSHSMDSLLLSNREPRRPRGQSSNFRSRSRKENGRVYDTLLEVSSILGTFSNAALERDEGSECGDLTHSLPTPALQSDGRLSPSLTALQSDRRPSSLHTSLSAEPALQSDGRPSSLRTSLTTESALQSSGRPSSLRTSFTADPIECRVGLEQVPQDGGMDEEKRRRRRRKGRSGDDQQRPHSQSQVSEITVQHSLHSIRVSCRGRDIVGSPPCAKP